MKCFRDSVAITIINPLSQERASERERDRETERDREGGIVAPF